MYKRIIIPLLSLLSLFLQSANTMDPRPYWTEPPKPLNILTVPYHNPPNVCQYQDFMTPCKVNDQACKTRKEKCGDATADHFNNEIFSAQYGFSHMTIHNGKYDSTHGIDDFRTAEKEGRVHHHFTESKAHTSKLDRKTNQGGNDWHGKRLDQAYQKGNLPLPHYQNARQALEKGEATRVLAHTTLSADQQHFSLTIQPILPNHHQRRQEELHSYCTFIHTPIQQFAQQYDTYQTPLQRKNLEKLNAECKEVLTSARPVQRLAPQTSSVPTLVKSYSRTNLYDFLVYLNKTKRYSYEMISRYSRVSSGTIGNLIRNRDHSPLTSYLSVWDSLKSRLPGEFAQWLNLPN
ncbi:MAG: hypothetical protein K0M45_07820 [Candidatus Paracaedibacteraceae bacterium]|nr:hypothetical protein [Candidatus Paracaedibacteraceae bacterium]